MATVTGFPRSPLLPPRAAPPLNEPQPSYPAVQPFGKHRYLVPLRDVPPILKRQCVEVTYFQGKGVCPCVGYEWAGTCEHVDAVAYFLRPIHA